jgi:hypothetical protein
MVLPTGISARIWSSFRRSGVGSPLTASLSQSAGSRPHFDSRSVRCWESNAQQTESQKTNGA